MNELGLNVLDFVQLFPHEGESPYFIVRLSEEGAHRLATTIRDAVRRCYISDDALQRRATELAPSLGGTAESRQAKIIDAKLPGPGSTMSGDFGEILVYIYQATQAHPHIAFGPKKWRLKQDRTKPAPYSDVVQFILPRWPTPSTDDVLLCAEVKSKATPGAFSPIEKAIEDCARDRMSRLTKTLIWLKERAISENLGAVQIAHLNRFINANDHPHADKRFRAVAVICSSFEAEELIKAPREARPEYTLVVISVPNLHKFYTAVFEAVRSSILPEA